MAPSSSLHAAALAEHVDATTAELLLEHMQQRHLQPGQPLVAPGWPTDVLYYLLAGELDVMLEQPGGTVRVGHIEARTWVGEAAFIDGGEATATVLATTPVHLLALRRADFDALCAAHPRAGGQLLHTLCTVLATRVQSSSSGVFERVDDGTFTLARPTVQQGPWMGLLARLTGATHG